MNKFLLGFSIGVSAGMVLAPLPGKQTRSRLGRQIEMLTRRLGKAAGMPVANGAPEFLEEAARQGESNTDRPGGYARQEELSQTPSQAQQPRPWGFTHQVPENGHDRGDWATVEILNRASRDQLLSVPGIGTVLAKRIIRHRPYRREQEVLDHGVLTSEVLQRLRRELVNTKRAA